MKSHGAIVVFVLIAAATIVSGESACNETWLNECEDTKTQITQAVKITDIEATDLDKLCEADKLEKTRKCITDTDCKDYEDGLAGRYLDVLDYVCPEDKRLNFTNAVKCVRTINLPQAECAKDDYQTNCKDRKKYLACTKAAIKAGAVESGCAEESAEVYVTVMQKIEKDPCPDNGAGTVFLHFAPTALMSCFVWMLLTRWLTVW